MTLLLLAFDCHLLFSALIPITKIAIVIGAVEISKINK